MSEPLDLEPVKAAWRRWDAGTLPAAEVYEFLRFDVPALVTEVERLRGVVCDLLDEQGAGMTKTRATLVGPTEPPTRDEIFTTG